jgi:hypothetical protein
MVPMTLREITYLTESDELKILLDKYNLKAKIFDNQRLFLVSNCIIFEIYGLVVEDFFYFDIYTNDLKQYSNIDRILSDFDPKKIQYAYQSQINTRKQVAVPVTQGYEINTLKAEQYFFTMLQLMDELLSDILLCKKNINKKHLTETFDFKKNELERILFND